MPSVSDNISRWRQKAEIDYISLFVPLWLAFNAWMKDRYSAGTDRESLERLKHDQINNKTYVDFLSLLQGTTSKSETFKDYLLQLHEALASSGLTYEQNSSTTISLQYAMTEYGSGTPVFEDLMRQSGQKNKIELVTGRFISDEPEKVYRSYIEMLYQVRCKLLHGDLPPIDTNERVIKFLYLTLSDITQNI